MATKEQIKFRALNKLGVIAKGQTLNAAQDADMEAAYSEVYHRLYDLDVITWGQDEEIPESVANEVAFLVAAQRTENYSISNERFQRVTAQAAVAEPNIRRALEPTYQTPMPVSDF